MGSSKGENAGHAPTSFDAGSLNDLARRALIALRAQPKFISRDPLDAATQWLLECCEPNWPGQLEDMKKGILGFDVTLLQAVNDAIPTAARELGERWMRDDMSFAQVTLASARLQHLLQLLADEWQPRPPRARNCLNLVVCTPVSEQHLIGPLVLANHLRRDGHSVRVIFDAMAEDVLEFVSEIPTEAVLVSAGSLLTLDSACRLLSQLRDLHKTGTRIILGGAIQNVEDFREKMPLNFEDIWITNDIEHALSGLVHRRHGAKIMVAE